MDAITVENRGNGALVFERESLQPVDASWTGWVLFGTSAPRSVPEGAEGKLGPGLEHLTVSNVIVLDGAHRKLENAWRDALVKASRRFEDEPLTKNQAGIGKLQQIAANRRGIAQLCRGAGAEDEGVADDRDARGALGWALREIGAAQAPAVDLVADLRARGVVLDEAGARRERREAEEGARRDGAQQARRCAICG